MPWLVTPTNGIKLINDKYDKIITNHVTVYFEMVRLIELGPTLLFHEHAMLSLCNPLHGHKHVNKEMKNKPF